ncbi:acyl-CoA reductase [Siansivirga zeaxanthinifaciens]|uniref:Acyl-CoA reductase n=1 Tax=Siansivirga zeaxanthinifaciens CC-SAMT-1 TaxID=1454006 RepID=A0A0C5WMB4_9FLAO|nr:acyl-CoA reductase [Siansivirga zeaxanthinifaciens]AJR04020.1 acyl-CoA reductase [Siansivirga zeaxanthinifaciens CC-SAMT-1]
MDLQERIKAFAKLGDFLSQFSKDTIQKKENIEHNEIFFDGFKHQLKLAQENNGWFTDENMRFSLEGWSKLLTEENLETWLKPYNISNVQPKLVAIIMAGNIPLVGFHDFLSVLITGHHVLVKQSSNDKHLIPYLAKYLEFVEPQFKGTIHFTDGKMENFDAVIATGSDNTARYFEYYFKNKPSIIRNNRNSVAVLTGNETEAEMKNLSEDIFRYYGLGCRNVSKIFIPKNYNFDAFFNGIYHWHPIIEKAKYANNYDYNKAVYLMSEFDMLENGFLMIKEDPSYASPIATVFYEYYDDIEQLKQRLKADVNKIQCVVAKGFSENEIAFGHTQKPELWDYADSVDSVEFLLAI